MITRISKIISKDRFKSKGSEILGDVDNWKAYRIPDFSATKQILGQKNTDSFSTNTFLRNNCKTYLFVNPFHFIVSRWWIMKTQIKQTFLKLLTRLCFTGVCIHYKQGRRQTFSFGGATGGASFATRGAVNGLCSTFRKRPTPPLKG